MPETKNDNWAGYVSLSVATFSLFVSIATYLQSDRNEKIKYIPHISLFGKGLNVSRDSVSYDKFEFGLVNNGIGTAVVTELNFECRGTKGKEALRVCGITSGYTTQNILSLPAYIAANQRVRLLYLDSGVVAKNVNDGREQDLKDTLDQVRKNAKALKIEIKYESLFGVKYSERWDLQAPDEP